tara:strand:- start:411 stop:707 length:297 start_codon:yes stop_codon:yes gene_type:complete
MNDIIVPNEDINSLMKDYQKKKGKYKTNQSLSKYEKTRVLSERANQINTGSPIFISNPERFQNSYQIAIEELNQKKIPFIIKRPFGNTFEYWKLIDLQ